LTSPPRRGSDAGRLGDPTLVILRRIDLDQTWWFSVFRSEQTGDHVLQATLREEGWPNIAIRLTADELAMFQNRPTDFTTFAKEFIASHDSPIFSPRKISIRSSGQGFIEIN